MNKPFSYLALAASVLLLQACGGSMLGTSDAEDHKLIPEPVDVDANRPRPSVNAPVMTTDERTLLDATGTPVLLRGVTLRVGEDPLERIESIVPIREVGSNVVRLSLSESTTADELEAVLLRVVEQGLLAVLTLSEQGLTCTADSERLFSAFDDLWMGRWAPTLVQDRFQPHIMLNLADGWGPQEVFTTNSLGYRVYMDTYKALIGQLRTYGFKMPIVVDAPGCGQDYHAFLANRGRELLAADSEKNVVLSVQGHGSRWRTGSQVASAMRSLEAERLPILMSSFGDFNAEEGAVRHMEILERGAGDYAANLAIDWQTSGDKVAYIATMNEALNIYGREVSVEVYVPAAYVEDKMMGLQVYMRDSEDRYAHLGWNSIEGLQGNAWNTLRRVVQDESSLGWMSEGFDLTTVTRIGVELVANGKAPEVGGDFRIDNIKVIDAAVPELLSTWTFDSDAEGWGPNWLETVVSQQDGALSLVRGTDQNEIIAESAVMPDVVFNGDVNITARVFIPESYAEQSTQAYLKFFSIAAEWQETDTLGHGEMVFGEWFDVSFQGVDWEGGSKLGIQFGELAGSYEPILFDDIMIYGLPVATSAMEWGIQYQADFSETSDGWGLLSWHKLPLTVSVEEGALVLLPRPSEVEPGTEDGITFAAHKTDLGTVENFSVETETMVLTMTLQLDQAYANAPEDFEFRVFMQDIDHSNHFNIAVWTTDDLTPGEWMTFEVEVDIPAEFNRIGTPRHLGFQVDGIYDMPDAPIKISQFLIEGDVPVESLEDVIDIVDFHYVHHFEQFSVDFVEGGLSDALLIEGISIFERSKPFGWIAETWIGAPEGSETLNISESVDTSVSLTERGEEIVSGKGGLMETSIPASFP